MKPTGLVILWVLCPLAACSQENTGALILLAVDEQYNPESQVAQTLATIQLLLDAEGGFAGMDPGHPQAEGFQVLDIDGDGQAELILQIDDVGAQPRLPVVRLDPGDNLGKRVGIKARGIDPEGLLAAYGGIDARKLFVKGQLTEIRVPFNLAFSHLPPRIVAVTPRVPPNPPGLAHLNFYASKPLVPGSLQGRVEVTIESRMGGVDQVEGHLEGPHACPFGNEMWKFVPDQCYERLIESTTLRLKILGGVTDEEGNPLVDATGQPGFEAARELKSNVKFGNCNVLLGCDQVGANPSYAPDLICNGSSGLYEPARCTVDPLGCEDGRLVFDAFRGRGDNDCQAVRFDTFHHSDSGSCVIQDPWPCNSRLDCSGVGEEDCSDNGQCLPGACDGAGGCQGDFGLVCVPERLGCLPRIGGCTADCSAFHGCPELVQDCTLLDAGAYQCR